MKWKIINLFETIKHKLWVAWYLFRTCAVLMKRALVHDNSKFSKQEAPYFEKALPKLRGLDYGSGEYMATIKSLGPALYHHYRRNTHHPEYWNGHIDEMSPLDLIELLCDWKAAGKRHATGDMSKSLEINRERFSIERFLFEGLERDAQEIGLV